MSTGNLIKQLYDYLLDLVYPPVCVNCQAKDSWLCPDCWHQIKFLPTTVCRSCGLVILNDHQSICLGCQRLHLQYVDRLRSATLFIDDNPIQQAIHSLKYHNHRAVATILGKMLIEAYQRYQLQVDVIVPVPLYSSRIKERGYNHSELLAKELSQTTNLPLNTTNLQRIRFTPAQVTLKAEARRLNVKGAFVCHNASFTGQTILLIDDVCTTGSTLEACALALKEAGGASVVALTLARTQYT